MRFADELEQLDRPGYPEWIAHFRPGDCNQGLCTKGTSVNALKSIAARFDAEQSLTVEALVEVFGASLNISRRKSYLWFDGLRVYGCDCSHDPRFWRWEAERQGPLRFSPRTIGDLLRAREDNPV